MKILALDVGGTAIKSAIIDDTNKISDLRTTPHSLKNIRERMPKIIEVVESYDGFDVISVATTGQVDTNKKAILFKTETDNGWEYVPFYVAKILQNEFGCPAYILNDCNAAALGEAHFGAGRQYNNFLCLTYGTGVGGAIIQDKKLYTGSRGLAGEVGHIVTHSGGKRCRCGRRGCYERYASTTSLVEKARKIVPELENAKQIFTDYKDLPDMHRVIRNWQCEVVSGLVTLTYVFNPECIILGGGIMEQECISAGVCDIFYKTIFETFSTVKLIPASLGNTAGLYGAVVYARQNKEKI